MLLILSMQMNISLILHPSSQMDFSLASQLDILKDAVNETEKTICHPFFLLEGNSHKKPDESYANIIFMTFSTFQPHFSTPKARFKQASCLY
jgi:hypothetical protein